MCHWLMESGAVGAVGDQWSWTKPESHIFFKELGAALRGMWAIREVLGDGELRRRGWKVFTDNTAVRGCLSNLYSRSQLGNNLVMPLAKAVSRGEVPRPVVKWVSTDDNIVDRFTRGDAMVKPGEIQLASPTEQEWLRSHNCWDQHQDDASMQ